MGNALDNLFSNSQMQSQIVSGSQKLAIEVYRRLKQDQQNLIVSPFSLSAALSMTLMGCRGKTAEELSQALFGDVIPEKDFESLAKEFKLLVGGAIESNKEVLSVGNFIYLHHNYKVLPDFKKTLEKNFSSKAKEVDFSNSQETVDIINDDISKATRGKIPQLLNNISDDTRLILANAVYFKGIWKSQFQLRRTKQHPFTLSSGEEVQVEMMNQQSKELFWKSEKLNCKVLQLPFENSSSSMVFLLPDKSSSINSLAASLTPMLLDELITSSKLTEKLEIWLPKFEFEGQHHLNPVLKELGINDLFSDESADLSGIAKNSNLVVSEVIQKAVIVVNEEGAEALAGTASIMRLKNCGSILPEFKADRPFLYLLISQNRNKNLVLFIGAVEDPRS